MTIDSMATAPDGKVNVRLLCRKRPSLVNPGAARRCLGRRLHLRRLRPRVRGISAPTAVANLGLLGALPAAAHGVRPRCAQRRAVRRAQRRAAHRRTGPLDALRATTHWAHRRTARNDAPRVDALRIDALRASTRCERRRDR
jgi:hypothetical protein